VGAIIVIDLSPPGQDAAERSFGGELAWIASQESEERLIVAAIGLDQQEFILCLPCRLLFAGEGAQVQGKLMLQIVIKTLGWEMDLLHGRVRRLCELDPDQGRPRGLRSESSQHEFSLSLNRP
jgi:hypothetical protein